MQVSLRTKGVLALTVLILYVVLIGVFLTNERRNLVRIVQDMENNQSNQALLAPIFNTLAHSLVQSQAILNSPQSSDGRQAAYEGLLRRVEPINATLQDARHDYPLLERDIEAFEQALGSLQALASNNHLAELRDREQNLIVKLHDILNGLQARSAQLAQEYHDSQQFISIIAIAANIVGAVGSMAVILIFFTTLTRDIKRLQERAAAIVAGYSGEPLRKNRNDEIGGLIDAVNRMQVDLRRWEQRQEVSRQQRFHQEKMAAVGSLASAIGHEVANPIAAISGVAQFMVDETRNDDGSKSKVLHDFAAEILRQTERITLILRQMMSLTTPPSPEPKLLDLNALIKSTCSFICYDKRFRGIDIDFDLDHDLPAVVAVADHITQIMVNLLINAADAMDHVTEKGHSRIRLATRKVGDEIQVTISDNGRGMSPKVLEKAFEESFTTKPAGKGRGIGLFLCKTLIEDADGRIALESRPNLGTTAHLFLPLRA